MKKSWAFIKVFLLCSSMICCSSSRGGINSVKSEGLLQNLDSLLLQIEPINVEGSEMLAEEVYRALFTDPVRFVVHVSLLSENEFRTVIDNLENPVDDSFTIQEYSQIIQDLQSTQGSFYQENAKRIIQALEFAMSKSWPLEESL